MLIQLRMIYWFERFLNSERTNADIDIDIPDNRRSAVYLHEKYGHERVAQITFSTMAQRAVIIQMSPVYWTKF